MNIYYCLKCRSQAEPFSFFPKNIAPTGSMEKYVKHTNPMRINQGNSIFDDPSQYCKYYDDLIASGSLEESERHRNLLLKYPNPIGKILDSNGLPIQNFVAKLVQFNSSRWHIYPTGSIANNNCCVCGESIA